MGLFLPSAAVERVIDITPELLRELGRRRQILLFTCQRRERAWLDAHGKEDAPA